jgi:hypothetical protein
LSHQTFKDRQEEIAKKKVKIASAEEKLAVGEAKNVKKDKFDNIVRSKRSLIVQLEKQLAREQPELAYKQCSRVWSWSLLAWRIFVWGHIK